MHALRTSLLQCARSSRLARAVVLPLAVPAVPAAVRSLSSSPPSPPYDDHSPVFENFIPTPPAKLSVEVAEGIADATQFYVRHGVSRQRLQALAQESEVPAVVKWQKMMEVFLTTQVHVIAGLGYGADEQGLTQYAHDLAACLQETDDTMRDVLSEIRRDTWRELVSTAFDLNVAELKTLSIVDARNLMHKVSSKMVEPEVLLEIHDRTAKLVGDAESDAERLMAEKHRILQHVIVNHVYLSGTPSLVEQAGFGSGEKGYASMQCAMSDHEGDPLINQYAAAAMGKVWEAAGLPLSAE